MLLSPTERRRPDKALEEMRQSGVAVDGMVFARFIALACSGSIVWFVGDAEFFPKTLGSVVGGMGCTGVAGALVSYAGSTPTPPTPRLPRGYPVKSAPPKAPADLPLHLGRRATRRHV